MLPVEIVVWATNAVEQAITAVMISKLSAA
jgi:hypothetical protein